MVAFADNGRPPQARGACWCAEHRVVAAAAVVQSQHEYLRQVTANYMTWHQSDFQEFTCEGEQSFEEYIAELRKVGRESSSRRVNL